MMRRAWWLTPTLAVVLLITACGQPLATASPTTEVSQGPIGAQQPGLAKPTPVATIGLEGYSHGGPLRDHVSFVDHLRGKGYQVEPVADVRQPFLRAEGTVLRVSGGGLESPAELQSYNYDDTDLGTNGLRAGEEDARKIGPDGQPESMSILWAGEPHFYRKERVLVLYVGNEKAVLDLMTELLGRQFAGGSTGEAGCVAEPRADTAAAPVIAEWEFRPATLSEAAERASVVVLARVTAVGRAPDGARQTSIGSRRVSLEVVKSLQGVPERTIRLFWGWAEEQYDENDPPYRLCEEYVLFLRPKADEKGTYLVVSPLGRYRLEEGKLQPVAKATDGIPGWVRELRGKSVGYLEKELAKVREGSPPATVDDLTDFGSSEVQVDGQVNEPERRAKFVRSYRAGKPGRWEVVFYTTEGDPISYELRYAGQGKAVVLIVDSTQDRFGSRQVTEYECERLVQEGPALRVARCAGEGEVRDIDIPWEHR